MDQQNALEKKKRCPNGFVRNKEGVCVPKVVKPKEVPNPMMEETVVPKKTNAKKTKKVSPKTASMPLPTGKKVSPKTKTMKKTEKTMKKMTKTQAAKLLAQRRECVQTFRDKM